MNEEVYLTIEYLRQGATMQQIEKYYEFEKENILSGNELYEIALSLCEDRIDKDDFIDGFVAGFFKASDLVVALGTEMYFKGQSDLSFDMANKICRN